MKPIFDQGFFDPIHCYFFEKKKIENFIFLRRNLPNTEVADPTL